MNLNSNKSTQSKLVLGMWTALWVTTSMTVSLALWGLQFAQSNTMSEGMKAQTELLTGDGDENIN